jgi:glycosyltransferase involved in cell wall biosynthesis
MDMRQPLQEVDVSVVIPTFHRERQLLEAIHSVLVQRRVSFEVIVIDDSVEGSALQAVQSVPDSRVRYVQRAEPSRGRPALVRNDGAQLARGRYLHFLDDDDVLEQDALWALSSTLDATPNAGMAFGVTVPFGDDEGVLRSQQRHFRQAARIARKLRGRLQLVANLVFKDTLLVNSVCMARRECFLACGGYDTIMPVCEDVDLWARISRAYGFVFVDRPIMHYRTGAPSLMHNLSESDARLHDSYRRGQGNYRARHGVIEFYLLKIWARTTLRWAAS